MLQPLSMNAEPRRPAEPGSEGYFQDRREYIPVGFGRNILLLTILKIPFRSRLRRYLVPIHE
jgi:hypothetical protein